MIPQMRYQNYKLLPLALNTVYDAYTGVYSSVDLYYMDLYFNQIKKSLNKVQTYVSLSGAKQLGGEIYIQIGDDDLTCE
jgi:hypothetical protein